MATSEYAFHLSLLTILALEVEPLGLWWDPGDSLGIFSGRASRAPLGLPESQGTRKGRPGGGLQDPDTCTPLLTPGRCPFPCSPHPGLIWNKADSVSIAPAPPTCLLRPQHQKRGAGFTRGRCVVTTLGPPTGALPALAVSAQWWWAFPCGVCSHSSPLPQPQAATDLLCVSMDLPLLDSSENQNHTIREPVSFR